MARPLLFLLALAACAGSAPAGDGTPGADGADGADASDGSDGSEVEDGPLPGAADDLASAAIPDQDPDRYDDETNVEGVGSVTVSTDRLVLAVTPTATVGELNALLVTLDATVLGGSPAGGLLVVQVAPGAAADAAETARSADGVAAAMVDFTQEDERLGAAHDSGDRAAANDCPSSRQRWRWDDDAVPRVPPGGWDGVAWSGANWGLKFARVPLAWNLRDHMSRQADPPTMGFVDAGFWAHGDLPGLGVSDPDGGSHGLEVASVAVAGFTDGDGIEGVFPRGARLDNTLLTAWFKDESVQLTWTSRIVTQSARLLGEGARILNTSQGMSRAYAEHPEDAERIQGLVATESTAWAGATAVLAANGKGDFLVTCSAGNSGPWYPARWNSGCAHRAGEGDTRFLSVEALAAPGTALASLSGTGAVLAAPGECVGTAQPGTSSDWWSHSGTSYAAPFVAGAAALVWAADPSLDHGAVRAALIDGAHPAVADVAPRVDAFGALLHIDALTGGASIQTALADLDDGTPDGNLRLAPEGSGLSATGPDDHLRGDGCVDIRDLRVLRDAILDAADGTSDDPLDGPADHLNRDLNGDGAISPGDDADHPDDPGHERVWARADLNGDLRVDAADVAVMAEVWGATDPDRCPVADTHGIAAADLERWVHSADLWVAVPTGEEPLVRADGAPVTTATAAALHGSWHLVSALLSCADGDEVTTCLHGDTVACDTRLARPGADEQVTDPAEVEGTDGLVLLSRDHGLYSDPLRIFVGDGGGWGDGVPLPDSEDLSAGSGFTFALSRDGHDLLFAGCPGDSLEDQRAASCISRVDVRSGGQTAVTPDATLDDWRLLDRDAGGRLLFAARDGIADRWFVIDDATWSFDAAEVVADQWSAYGPRLHTPGVVLNFGGFDGDSDSNGLHLATTHSVLAWDDEAEAAICLDYGDRQVGDVFRAFVPTGAVVSPDGLVLTRPYGTTTPGTGVASPGEERFVELDPMTADYGAWSPDGAAVAFGAWGEGTVVAVLGAGDDWDDGSLATIEEIPLIAGTLRWSPDGTRLMIVDDSGLAWGEADVWVYDLATGEIDVLSKQHEVSAGTPAWSPDGSAIATASWFTDGLSCDGQTVEARHLDIVTESVDDGTLTRETETFVAAHSGWPECGGAYPTNEFGPHWR